MLQSIKTLRGHSIVATDGEIGKLEDFFFDDVTWTIRYFVVDTGSWLFGKRVLISPTFAGPADPNQRIPVTLTREQVKNSPDIDTRKPVSRQRDLEMAPYLGWPAYGIIGEAMFPPPVLPPVTSAQTNDDPHLRSTSEVLGYHISATDGDVGKVVDFAFSEQSWQIRFLVVDTGSWLSKDQVLIAPSWISDISWEDRAVRVELDVESIRRSPEFHAGFPIAEDYVLQLQSHYGKDHRT